MSRERLCDICEEPVDRDENGCGEMVKQMKFRYRVWSMVPGTNPRRYKGYRQDLCGECRYLLEGIVLWFVETGEDPKDFFEDDD